MKCGKTNNLRLACPLPHPPCWDTKTAWTQEEKRQIIAEREAWCAKCERKLNTNRVRPISETTVTPDDVERIEKLMVKCLVCPKANFIRCEPQPDASKTIPATLRLAFTRAEYIHGVQGLTCQDRSGCCALSKAMKDQSCEKWNDQHTTTK